MTAAELLVRCLENEGIPYIFGIPGEENIDVMDALLTSSVRFITTRHEQGAAFMADVHGRLTGQAGVCLATLGPGATNLVTGVADANMDRAPVVAIAGQASTERMHKESHQHLDLVSLFKPISKYSTQIVAASTVPEVVRKAFKEAQSEKPGVSFIDFPENIAAADAEGLEPLKVQSAIAPDPHDAKVAQAAEVIAGAKHPLIMAGNGVVRGKASDELVAFAESLNIPVATTFMAKGVIPFSHPQCLGTVGLKARDYIFEAFAKADVILCVGYDMVEYPPELWHPTKDRKIIHIDRSPAEVDAHYMLELGVIGDIGLSLQAIQGRASAKDAWAADIREKIRVELSTHNDDTGFPVKPQKIAWDLRQALGPEDIVLSDVGAHKMWLAREYQAERPNTCIISNGFASMGIALPGAIAAKLAYPDRKVVAVCGDAGFMMNCQEIETAMRLGTALVVLIWNDAKYGLIEWHQLREFGRPSHIDFTNPDFVTFAESFGAKGYRVDRTEDLLPTLKQAIADDTVVIVDCPVDYAENMKLTERLGKLMVAI